MLEALTLRFTANPNRSMRTVPIAGVPPDGATTVLMTLVIGGDELLPSLRSMGAGPHLFPISERNETQATMEQRLLQLLQQPELRVSFRFIMRPNGEQWTTTGSSFLGVYEPAQNPKMASGSPFPLWPALRDSPQTLAPRQ